MELNLGVTHWNASQDKILNLTESQQQSSDVLQVAKKLEASFIAEMLKSMKYGETPESFGGGAGEDQFSSFLRQEQANRITETGGIGLAETLFRSIAGQTDE